MDPRSSSNLSMLSSFDENRTDGLRLLALDGGGIRGLSELVILDELMRRIQAEKGLSETPRPCEYFDLVGGTSTGGLIALMLGRLGMTIEAAIEAYTEFAKAVFSEKKYPLQDGKYKASALVEAIKRIVLKHEGDAEARMRTDRPFIGTNCKTFVCAMPAYNMSQPRLFRSYGVRENETYNCTIWEAARATSAAPTIFKSVTISDNGVDEVFVDGGLRCNNPVAQVVKEAELVFGGRKIACIVSIGTGHPNVIDLPKADPLQRFLSLGLVNTLKDIAADCEAIAEDFEQKHKGDNPRVYFRFNVQQGLQGVLLTEWDKLGVVKTHTVAYLEKANVGSLVNEVRDILKKEYSVNF